MNDNLYMRFPIIFIILSSCGFDLESDPLHNLDLNQDIFLWKKESLPVNIGCDDNLSLDEISSCENAIDQWENAAQVKFVEDLYIMDHLEPKKIDEYYYKDVNFGIHKPQKPIEDLGPETIATCQLFVEYIDKSEGRNVFAITHADIIFNDYHFDFDQGESTKKFDFETVITHEFGHFIGLMDKDHGTMCSCMGPGEIQREVDQESADKAYEIYHSPAYEKLMSKTRKPASQPKKYRIQMDINSHRKKVLRSIQPL